MLQKTFDIKGSESIAAEKFIEAGEKYLACWNKTEDSSCVNAFEFFQFEETDFSSFEELLELANQKSQILSGQSSKTFFVWNNAEAACVPTIFYSDILAADFVNITHGEMKQTYLHSQPTGDITVVSRLKMEKQQAAEKYFNGAQFGHAWTYLLKNNSINPDKKFICLNFYPGTFTLAAFAENKLRLLQSRKYQLPEDVLYYVLNFLKQYNWNKEDTKIFAAGLIDPHSKLFDTLHQYLDGFETATPANGLLQADDFKNYPQHFFLPFANYKA